MKKVVCFGGGNAMPKAVLTGLKKYLVDITSVTSMVDNGGSAGWLRKEFKVLPPGDIRRHLLALSQAPQWKRKLWQFRFGEEVFEDGHRGHNFANIFIAGLEYVLEDFGKALEYLHKFLEVKGQVFPATIDKTNLKAKLENGKIIFGEPEIDFPQKHNPKLKIEEVFLSSKAKAYPPVLQAIKEVNLIIIGPGDLYSSLIPCFLMTGMRKVIKESKAKKVFICNPLNKLSETNNFSVSDFTKEVERYLGCQLDFVIYNNKIPKRERIKKYKKENPHLTGLVKINNNLKKEKFIGKNLLLKKGPIEYDQNKISKIILSL